MATQLRAGILAAAFALVLGWSPSVIADNFQYDSANRLVRAQRGDVIETFRYDGQGQLVQTCARRRGQPTSCKRLVIDTQAPHPRVAAELRGNTPVIYAYGPLGIELVNGPGGTRRVLTDPLGSVMAELDAAGQTVARRAYDPFGKTRAEVGQFTTAHGFTGELQGPSGLVYLRARHYDPGLGRFLQRDTFAGHPSSPDSLNRYAYAHGNPLVHRDPSGHWIESAWDVASFGMGVHDLATGWGDAGGWERAGMVTSVLVDGGAVILPFIPAGVSISRRAASAALDAKVLAASEPFHKAARRMRDQNPYGALKRSMAETAREHNLIITARARARGAQRWDPLFGTKSNEFTKLSSLGELRIGSYAPSMDPVMEMQVARSGHYYVVNTPDIDLGSLARIDDGALTPVRLGDRASDAVSHDYVKTMNGLHQKYSPRGSQRVVHHGEQDSGLLAGVKALWKDEATFNSYWHADVHVWTPKGYAGIMEYQEVLKVLDPQAHAEIRRMAVVRQAIGW